MKLNKKLEQEILSWHKKTFPEATLESQVLKWQEEFRELEFSNDYKSYIQELCDCIIIATGFKRFTEIGLTLSEVFNNCLSVIINEKKENYEFNSKIIEKFVEEKLKINKKRKWKFIDGVYKHVEEIENIENNNKNNK